MQYINPDTLFPSEQYGFSQVVVASGKRIAFISGQTGWDADAKMEGGATLYEQAVRSLRNVQSAIEAAGGTIADIAALRIYIVDYAPAKSKAVRRALIEAFDEGKRPASSWVGVSALAEPEFLIEVEATAVME
ncbi:MAG TPA: RidA family protein [Oleiagrimonas sp.]|nr:RidA family protein [Oleiagrimonas sp.]